MSETEPERMALLDPSSKQMVDTLLDLGNMTRLESDFVTRISQVLEKGLGLWYQEKFNLQRIYDERMK